MSRFVRRAAKGLGLATLLLLIATAAGLVWFRSALRQSLPLLEGEVAARGLSAPVSISFDALGVPLVKAARREDAAFATGFLHAQNRYFQMDLMRREAAGDLAALLGPSLVARDRAIRPHRFRAVARRAFERAADPYRRVLVAYTAGANAGLAALGRKPFEYLLLRADPEPWREEDCFLVILAMFIELNDEDGSRESALGTLHDLLPEPLFDFLAPRGTEWDAPVLGGPPPDPPLPGPEVFDLRAAGKGAASALQEPWSAPAPAAGSNNWAVAGRLTRHGGAILENDMHLGLSVPNIWYRASLQWDEGAGRITGVTLPGAPAVVAGSNGHVAWGFTNSYGDWTDVVIVEEDPSNPNRYLSPEGPRSFDHHAETIKVKGAASVALDVVSTVWGPVIGKDHRGRTQALRWTAYDDEGVNLGLLDMESAGGLDEALDRAARSGVPPENCVIADSTGRIGWTIMGAIPRRAGFDGRLPVSWADGSRRWDGYLKPEDYPRIVDPPSGRIWTANARVVEGDLLSKVGDGGYDLGARARQIRDDLAALDKPAERDLLNVALDDRAIFLSRWRDLLLRTLTPSAASSDPRRAEYRRLVEATWTGRASIDSAGYRLVRAFRSYVLEKSFAPLTAACRKADPHFDPGALTQEEGPMWRLLTERPAHLLDPAFKDWDALLLAAVDEAIAYFTGDGTPLSLRTWGERNRLRMRHPISLALPFAGRWLDMPADPLPGDAWMPRVQGPDFGASERMVVSPGREQDALFEMPGGESGHPLSPHYGDGHAAWARGEATPFLPGPAVHTLVLRPAQR